MSTDWRPPADYVNPVPEPGTARRRPKLDRSSLSSSLWFRLLRVGFVLIAMALVVKGPIRDAFERVAPVEISAGSAKVDGTVNSEGSNVSATYTPAGGETANRSARNGVEFRGSEWNLVKGDEIISVRDYRFDHSPIKDRATLESYYAATANQVNMKSGHDIKAEPITVDGRDGRVWESRADDGRWVLLAEFPGDPHTIRMECNAASVESVIVKQCREVLRTLRFGE